MICCEDMALALVCPIVVVLQETIIVFVIGAEICASKFAGAVDQLDHDIRS